MNVIISATSRFHYFDLAKQLQRLGVLKNVFTGYPSWKIDTKETFQNKVNTFPWVHTLFMMLQRTHPRPTSLSETLDLVDRLTFDAYVERKLSKCDVFTAISGCGLRSGIKAKSFGARYVCDRGSTHILYQNKILKEESSNWGFDFTPTHPAIIERELQEYAEADLITVPSLYAKQSFIDEGIASSKLAVIPYGVDISTFHPTGIPDEDTFVVAYAGGLNFRKGIQYLFKAFASLKHPRKILWLIGQADKLFIDSLIAKGLCPPESIFTGHVNHTSLKNYFSKADVLVLPSVEDGFGMVMAQALACGCPVIASTHTGGKEIIEEGINGYIVPARDWRALREAIQNISDRHSNTEMRLSAASSAKQMSGWNRYGEQILNTYNQLVSNIK